MWPPRSPPPTKPSRSDRQRPGETAGERRRGRRIGADVPTLTGPDFVLTSGAQVAPTVEPWPAGVAAPVGLVPRPPSERCRSWSYEAGPAADTASAWSVLPYMPPPAATPQPSPTRPSRQRPREGGNPGWRRGAPSRTYDCPQRPRNPPLQGRRASDPSTDPHDSQSKEANQSRNQPPLFPPDPLQKSEKKVKDNPKWRIN